MFKLVKTAGILPITVSR